MSDSDAEPTPIDEFADYAHTDAESGPTPNWAALRRPGGLIGPSITVAGLSVLDHSVDGGSSMFTLGLTGTNDVRPDLYRIAVENGWVLTELHREEARLEDVFRQLTSEKAYSKATA